MVAALTRVFGVHNLALAEDVVQDALCRALEVWKFRGVPDNPSAWLMATAKNRAIDVLRRERTARTFAPELGRLLETEWTLAPVGRGAVRSRTRSRTTSAADDVLVLPPAACRRRRRSRSCSTSCAASASTRSPRAFLSGQARRSRSASRAAKKVLAARSASSIWRTRDCAAPPLGRSARALPAVQRGLPRRVRGVGGARRSFATRRCGSRPSCSPTTRRATPSTHALAALMCLHAARLPGRVDARAT